LRRPDWGCEVIALKKLLYMFGVLVALIAV
jgi:hypothetical protein